jgi:hypothetical protein
MTGFALGFVLMTAFAMIPIAIVRMLLQRDNSVVQFMIALAVVAAMIAGVKVGIEVGWRLRKEAFQALAMRSQALVSAIERYDKQHGQPPTGLDDLVPELLPAIPSTGMGGYPKYNYFVGSAAENYQGNRWAIEVFTPGLGINFDRFIYFPDQNYAEFAFGGSLERIATWAYVHE